MSPERPSTQWRLENGWNVNFGWTIPLRCHACSAAAVSIRTVAGVAECRTFFFLFKPEYSWFNFTQRKAVLPTIISNYPYAIACFPSPNMVRACKREETGLSPELRQVRLTEFPCEKPPSVGSWSYEYFFEGVCACMRFLFFLFFFASPGSVCLHGLCICIIVFSGRLAVPVRARVQVVHDPDSAGRSVSFMSSARFYLESGSKDERITLIRHDTHALTLAPVSLKNDFLEVWSGNKVALRRTLKQSTFKIHPMSRQACSKSGSCHLCLLTAVTHCMSYSFTPCPSPLHCLSKFVSAHLTVDLAYTRWGGRICKSAAARLGMHCGSVAAGISVTLLPFLRYSFFLLSLMEMFLVSLAKPPWRCWCSGPASSLRGGRSHAGAFVHVSVCSGMHRPTSECVCVCVALRDGSVSQRTEWASEDPCVPVRCLSLRSFFLL